MKARGKMLRISAGVSPGAVSCPASIKSILRRGSSGRRAATTAPADPPPITMTSACCMTPPPRRFVAPRDFSGARDKIILKNLAGALARLNHSRPVDKPPHQQIAQKCRGCAEKRERDRRFANSNNVAEVQVLSPD